jgi:hypothetical protein
MNKEEFLIKAQVYYYKHEGFHDNIFELLDEDVKNAIIEENNIAHGVFTLPEFEFMIKNSKYFTDYLEYNIYEAGDELSEGRLVLLSEEQKLEYCKVLEKVYVEDCEDEDWYKHPLYIWYNSFKREQQIKSVLDD